MNLRFQFLDKETKEWFKPTYKPLNDLLLTGNGDIYSITQEEGEGPKTKIVTAAYEAVQYVGIRDVNQKKYYINSIVKFPNNGGVGVLIWDGDKLAIGSGPIDNYTAVDQVSERELKEAEIIGHASENPKFFDTYIHK